jgi:hypothetical protein
MMIMKKSIIVFALVALLLLMPRAFAVGQACNQTYTSASGQQIQVYFDKLCSTGEMCGGEGKCVPCSTSAECVKGTFEKSVPSLGAVSPWFVISAVAVLICMLAVAIIFMLGNLFNSDQMKRLGKAEFAQAVASLILIAMLFGTQMFEQTLIGMMEQQTGVFTAAVFSPQEFQARQAMKQTMTINPFDVSLAYLRKLGQCLENQYKMNYDRGNIYEFLSNMQLQFSTEVPILGAVEGPYSPLFFGFSEKLSESEYMADQLTWLGVFTYMQIAIMKFVETSMFTIFLPIGIILRAFPPTRGAGAVMIALAIGFYMVYPFTYTILVASAPKVIEGCNLNIEVGPSTQLQKACPIAPGAMPGAIEQAQSAAATLDISFPQVKSGASTIFYIVWINMLISIGAALMFTRTISPLLGADISEIGRSMFKMM